MRMKDRGKGLDWLTRASGNGEPQAKILLGSIASRGAKLESQQTAIQYLEDVEKLTPSAKLAYAWMLITSPYPEIANPKKGLSISSSFSKKEFNDHITIYELKAAAYAALGKLVVNASLSNPHFAYNFNIHPKSISEYEEILMGLPEQQLDIDINEVYEYYYMKLGRDNMANWLFLDYDSFIEDIGGYKNQFTSISYQRFIDTFSHDRHKYALLMLNNFIDSGDYCMQKKHYSN